MKLETIVCSSTHFNQNEYSINSYEAGKRSRTFIAPSIISKGDEFVMGISTPGGNVIPQALAQVINWNLREGPRDAGQKAGHCRYRVHRDHLGDHHGQCAGGGGLPDGGHLHQPAAGPAGQLPGRGRSGVAGHRAAGSAGLSVSGRPAHHQTEKTAEGGLTR